MFFIKVLKRDFTYIDDIVKGIKNHFFLKIILKKNHKIFNLGNNKPVSVNKIVSIFRKNIK